MQWHKLHIKALLITAFMLLANTSFAQDSVFARKMVDTLTSPYFWGRGYTHNGLNKTAAFLTTQFKLYGLQPLAGNSSYQQEFSFPVNTFPGKMELAINGIALLPGIDFIVDASSRGVKAEGTLVKKDSTHYTDAENRIILTVENKLTWGVAQKVADYTSIQVSSKALKGTPASVQVDIENKFISSFKTANVCGVVKGTARPDSFIVISGHYDHLGGLGKNTYFPGANDNASGITLLLGLARYYAAHPQPYSIVFICFAGEEAGLVGSEYFTRQPLIPLPRIRFLINTDMVGTGSQGITVVNATLHPREFAVLKQINDENSYLVNISARGKAANSDHHWFTEKDVPSFFIYTMGGIRAYHDVYDISPTLPLTEYQDLFNLLLKFNERLMQP